jgi:mycothiol synthase
MIRRAESDADLEAWRQVRMAVHPDKLAPTVAELREWGRFMLIAELDGRIVGSGTGGAADTAGRGFVAPRVLSDARRRGISTALLRELGAHVESLGYDSTRAMVADPGSLAFARHFGFEEIDRQVEQVRAVGDEPAPDLPGGIEIVSVAQRPVLWREAHAALGVQAIADMAVVEPIDISLEQWEREWINWPEATFLALAGGEIVGTAGLMRDPDRSDRAENTFTAVRRDWRGLGVASALKRTALAFAADNGIREVYTWTQRGNDDMRRLNEHLGYVTRSESITLRASLPLP